MFGLTKVDGKNEDIEQTSSDGEEGSPEVLSDADLIFPNYLIGEDGSAIHGLNLNVEMTKHMKDVMKTKINFANYQLSNGNNSINIPNYMKKPKRPPQSEIALSTFENSVAQRTQDDDLRRNS